MAVALANSGRGGDGTRPTAPLHSVVEEKGGCMSWRVRTCEHGQVDGKQRLWVGREEAGAGGDKQGIK